MSRDLYLKKCASCRLEKELSAFCEKFSYRDGLNHIGRECVSKQEKLRYVKKNLGYCGVCAVCDKDFVDTSHTQVRRYCLSVCRMQVWRPAYLEHHQKNQAYRQRNKDALQKKWTSRHRQRCRIDPQYCLKNCLRSRLLKIHRNDLKIGSAIVQVRPP